MLTMDEYLAIRRLISSERESEGSSLSDRRRDESPPSEKKRNREKTDYDRRLQRALLEVNKTARLKNGSFRKGWSMSKVMKKAHKLARKYGPSTKKGQVRKTARRAYKR